MTHRKSKTPWKKRRRNCWDRLRARMLEVRRRRPADPAVSVAAQLLALFALIFGRMSVIPTIAAPAPYVPPPMSPGHAHRIETARRLGIPSRYVDIVLAQGTVPYSILFQHIRRGGGSRENAMSFLRTKAPEPSVDWLDHVETWGLWSVVGSTKTPTSSF